MTEIQITVVTGGHGPDGEEHSDPPRDDDTEPFEKEGMHEAVFGKSFADMFCSGRQKVEDKANGVSKSYKRNYDFTMYRDMDGPARHAYGQSLKDRLISSGMYRGADAQKNMERLIAQLKGGEIDRVMFGPQNTVLAAYMSQPHIQTLDKAGKEAEEARFLSRTVFLEPGRAKMRGEKDLNKPQSRANPIGLSERSAVFEERDDLATQADADRFAKETEELWARVNAKRKAEAEKKAAETPAEPEKVPEPEPEPEPAPAPEPEPTPEPEPEPAPAPTPKTKGYQTEKFRNDLAGWI